MKRSNRHILSAALACALFAILSLPGVLPRIMQPLGAAPIARLQEFYGQSRRFDKEAEGLRPLGRFEEADQHTHKAAIYRKRLIEASPPYLLLIALVFAIAAIPQFNWRYSLRTLLIAMTLVAVGLGWAVYANRN